jgi:hypothetical protein
MKIFLGRDPHAEGGFLVTLDDGTDVTAELRVQEVTVRCGATCLPEVSLKLYADVELEVDEGRLHVGEAVRTLRTKV